MSYDLITKLIIIGVISSVIVISFAAGFGMGWLICG